MDTIRVPGFLGLSKTHSLAPVRGSRLLRSERTGADRWTRWALRFLEIPAGIVQILDARSRSDQRMLKTSFSRWAVRRRISKAADMMLASSFHTVQSARISSPDRTRSLLRSRAGGRVPATGL